MKKFIHVDLDAFYASVETRDNPEWRGLPLAVGGRSDRRGVIATCNYEARAFGIHSAMPTRKALELCPHLILVRGRMEVYKAEGLAVREIMASYTDKIEPLSLDEAYLDVTDSPHFQGSATRLAETLRHEIFEKTGLTASAGVAPAKFLAKIASDLDKPNGLSIITPDQAEHFIDTLPLRKISGVGKVSAKKLADGGFHVGADIKRSSEAEMFQCFGKFGASLWRKCQLIDVGHVNTDRIRRSIGVERTFAKDLIRIQDMVEVLIDTLLPELNKRIERANASGRITGLTVKIKFKDFQQTTIECQSKELKPETLHLLLNSGLDRRPNTPIRLLGIGVRLNQDESESVQYELF